MQSPQFTNQFQAGVAFAAELSKQLIALSTGILTLTVTFSEKLAATTLRRSKRLLAAAWIAYLMTIIFALAHLSALTGSLIPIDPTSALDLGMARFFASMQILAFIVATSIIIWVGVKTLQARR